MDDGNQICSIESIFTGVSGEGTVKLLDDKHQQHIDVKCPDIVCSLSQSMGVVNFLDILISYYCTNIKSD